MKQMMEDEVAEAAGIAQDAPVSDRAADVKAEADKRDEDEARQRLSAVERAQNDYWDLASPAKEILDQIKSRKQRLEGDDEA